MPAQDLTVGIVQQPLVWKDPMANRTAFAERIAELDMPHDLIVLPEMFTAGFSMDVRSVAEPEEGETLGWMAEVAKASGSVITGSYAVLENNEPVNRLVWMSPDGSYQTYAKKHLFRMMGEDKRYKSGNTKIFVEVKGWRVLPLICYDLRFPVWCRNRGDYDLMVFVANWPAAREKHWSTLLKARAIENLACVVGVNRIGVDGKGNDYSGGSIILDARGEALVEPKSEQGIFTGTLSAAALNDYREAFPAHLDADDFTLNMG